MDKIDKGLEKLNWKKITGKSRIKEGQKDKGEEVEDEYPQEDQERLAFRGGYP